MMQSSEIEAAVVGGTCEEKLGGGRKPRGRGKAQAMITPSLV